MPQNLYLKKKQIPKSLSEMTQLPTTDKDVEVFHLYWMKSFVGNSELVSTIINQPHFFINALKTLTTSKTGYPKNKIK